jgi:hypothetical protein
MAQVFRRDNDVLRGGVCRERRGLAPAEQAVRAAETDPAERRAGR